MKIILTDNPSEQNGKFVHVETPGGLRAYAGRVFKRKSMWKHNCGDNWFITRKRAIADLVAQRTAGKAVQS